MSGFEIDDDLIRRLADLMAEKGLSEIELESDDRRLRVSRAAQVVSASVPMAAAPGPMAAPGPAAAAPTAQEQAAGPAGAKEGAITSPMVGTVYTAAEPGAPPFVSVGDEVAEGDTLMIVEAMKVMNPIRAPKAGTVREIVVTNAQPVEYGEVLMVIA